MNKPRRRNQAPAPEFKLSWPQKFLLLLGLIVLSFAALPVVIILIIGLLPSITVILTNPKNMPKLMIVGFFNLSGVFVCMMNIYSQFASNHSINILDNVFNIIIMLGSAALGMILYFELPNLFVMISRASANRRLQNIDAKLEKISSEWGSEAIEGRSVKN